MIVFLLSFKWHILFIKGRLGIIFNSTLKPLFKNILPLISIRQTIVNALFLVLLFVLIFLLDRSNILKDVPQKNILLFALLPIGLVLLILLKREIKNRNKYKKFFYLLIKKEISREEIQTAIKDLSWSYKLRYIRYLESHVKTVTGEWPDPLFLSDKNSEAITRLAKLEEKWLGLDR